MTLPEQFTKVSPLSKTLAGIIFIALPFVGFFAGTSFQKSITPANQATTEKLVYVTSTPLVTLIPTEVISAAPLTTTTELPTSSTTYAGWKTYTNSRYKFTARYPSDWKVEEQVVNKCGGINNPEDSQAICVLTSFKSSKDTGLIISSTTTQDKGSIGPSWYGAGEFIKKGTVVFNKKNLSIDALVLDNKTKQIVYNPQQNDSVSLGNTLFYLSYKDFNEQRNINYEVIDLNNTEETKTVQKIIESIQ